jgi:hypothetical protein
MPATLSDRIELRLGGPRAIGGLIVALMLPAATGCRPASEQETLEPNAETSAGWLIDVTAASGVTFKHTTGGSGALHLPEIMGGGVAVFDADGDGLLDLYFVNQNGGLPSLEPSVDELNGFYRQTEGGRFEDATKVSGLGDGGYGLGVAVGDIDNDGDRDLYVTNLGADRLYRNDGRGIFEDITGPSGITLGGLSASAAFLDFDRDGDLDLFVSQYVDWDPAVRCTATSGQPTYCGPTAYSPVSDHLLRNEGDGRFSDISVAAGFDRVTAAGLGVVVEDFNLDGWPDIYVANDAYANNLWINQHDGRFIDDALPMGAALNYEGQPEAGMGVVATDLDQDGRVDLFVTHLDKESNTLYRGLAQGAGFDDATSMTGLGAPSWPLTGFGVAAFDIELDGDLDLAVANGRVTLAARAREAEGAESWNRLAEPNQLFLNGAGDFALAESEGGAFSEQIEISRGLIAADIDADGDQDLVSANIQGAPRIFENQAPREGGWLSIQAIDPALDRDAIGARVGVELDGRVVWRTIGRSSGYLSSGPAVAHFALPLDEEYQSLRVTWPDGLQEVFPGGVESGRRILRRGEGRQE